MNRGNLLVGQAGGATAVINATLVGVVEEARAQAYHAIWGMRRGVEGALDGEFVDLTSLDRTRLEGVASTPGAALGASRHRLSDDEVERLLDLCVSNRVNAFLYIGGNDSADTTHRLAHRARERSLPLAAIAVPKTIDNDLPHTDHSPGYPSIARYVAAATMDSAQDTASMPTMYPVKFIEVMGRDAGWVAAAATLGKREPEDAPHLIYVPERPVSREELLAGVARVHETLGHVVAVVAETVRDPAGNPFADASLSVERDAFGHQLLRGTADAMVRLVQSELGLRARFDKPGSLQRMSMAWASPIDLAEARAVGRAAVVLAVNGETDLMVTLEREPDGLYRCVTGSVPLAAVANRQWLLPSEYLETDGRMTTEAFRRYALPLLGPEPLPVYERLGDLPAVRLAEAP